MKSYMYKFDKHINGVEITAIAVLMARGCGDRIFTYDMFEGQTGITDVFKTYKNSEVEIFQIKKDIVGCVTISTDLDIDPNVIWESLCVVTGEIPIQVGNIYD